MRIAVLVLGLLLFIVVGIQSCMVSFGELMVETLGTEPSPGTGVVGILVAILFGVGSAFTMKMPRVSIGIFAFGGILGLAAASSFPDLRIWGIVSFILAIMSYFGYRELKRKRLYS